MAIPKKSIASVAGVTALVGAIYASQDQLDKRYASKSIEIRVAMNELQAIYQQALSNKYFYQEQVRKYPNDRSIRQKLREAQEEVRSIKKKLDSLDLKRKSGG